MKVVCGLVGIAVLTLLSLGVFAQDTVVIVRHGEKPADGDNLTCKGLNRALALPRVLDARFSVAKYVYVPTLTTKSHTKHARMFETIAPYAVKHNLDINSAYDKDDYQNAGGEIASKMGKGHGTIVVAWEHHNIPPLAKAIGVPGSEVPNWPDDDFDSIWIITGFDSGKPHLIKVSEGLNGVSNDCGF